MNKRGIELQFHWIFIMVAGALILTFFGTIAQKQYNLSVQKAEYQLVNDLETAFSITLKTPNIVNSLFISSPIEFKCTDECSCAYKIGSAELPFYNKLIFSADKQSGDVKLWSPDFEKPFRAATFMIISSDENKYYLVHDLDTTELEKLKSKLNNQLNIEFINRNKAEQKQYSGEKKTRFIYYLTSPTTIDSSFNDKDVDAVQLDNSGSVSFYNYEGQFINKGFSQYSQDDASFFAAMFSADKNMYECQMKKVFKRLSEVGEVYKERTNQLLVSNPNCLYFANKIENVKSIASDADLKRFSELNGAANDLERHNQEDIIKSGCPEIY